VSQGGKGHHTFPGAIGRCTTGTPARKAPGIPSAGERTWCIRSVPPTSLPTVVRFVVRRDPAVTESPDADPSTWIIPLFFSRAGSAQPQGTSRTTREAARLGDLPFRVKSGFFGAFSAVLGIFFGPQCYSAVWARLSFSGRACPTLSGPSQTALPTQRRASPTAKR